MQTLQAQERAEPVSDLGFRVSLPYKHIMNERKRYRRRHRVRFRNARKLKLFLLALGLAGICLGILLIAYCLSGGDARLGLLGVVYLLGAVSILAARQGMIAWDADRKSRRASSDAESPLESPSTEMSSAKAARGDA